MMKNLLAELSTQLTVFSEDEKYSRFVPAGITAVNYIKEQFDVLYKQRNYHSFGNNKKPLATHSCSFFAASVKRLPAESTNQAVLSELMRNLARKINDINLEDHSTDALNIFVRNISSQLILFKTSAHKNHSLPASQDFNFLSNFRERKITVAKETDRDLNGPMNYA